MNRKKYIVMRNWGQTPISQKEGEIVDRERKER